MRFEDFKVGTIFYTDSGKWECIGIDENLRQIFAKKRKHHPSYVVKMMRTSDHIFTKLKGFSNVCFKENVVNLCNLEVPEGMHYNTNSVLGFEYVV